MDTKEISTIPRLLKESAEVYPDRPALIARDRGKDRIVTYGQLSQIVMRMAQGLASLGVRYGERIAILGPNSPEWAQAYLAITLAGGVCVPIDSLLSPNEIRHLLFDAEARIAFVASKFLDTVLDNPRGFPGPDHVILLNHGEKGNHPGTMSLEDLMAKGGKKGTTLPEGLGPQDLAAIIYTSGTTGNPKGVMLTHGNIISDVEACRRAIRIEEERFLSVLPLHHTFECTAGFLLPLRTGCTVTFARSLKSRDILEDLKASRATVMLGVPLLFQKMLEGMVRAIDRRPYLQRGAFKSMLKIVRTWEKFGRPYLGRKIFKGLRERAGLGTLKYLVVGGAPLMPHIPRGFRRLGFTMLQGYGLTEASPVLTLNPPESPLDSSVGIPLPGVQVRIIEPDEDGTGELAFKGPMIMKGYYKNPEATRHVLDEDGWLKTGDLGYQDKNGYVYISGRAKNLIVSPAGKNIYPEEIEAELNRSIFILESMVYGKRANDTGEEVCALIVPDYRMIGKRYPGGHLEDFEIERIISREVRAVNKQMASFKKIKSFKIVNEEFPKTSTRKIKRHLMQV